jgi:chromosome segregation ATPase
MTNKPTQADLPATVEQLTRQNRHKAALLAVNGSRQKKLQQRLLEMQGRIDELTVKLDHAESRCRETQIRLSKLTDAGREVCRTVRFASSDEPGKRSSDDFLAMRHLADILNYPGWWQL